jgi:phospholipid transport system substrate-binding protein
VNTYTNAFTQYRDQTVSYLPVRMQPGDTDVTVRSRINQPGGQAIPVDYAMEKLADGWKVYDVTIEGISLVQTYRGTFDQEVQRGGVDGLIKAITAKNQALATARQQGQ